MTTTVLKNLYLAVAVPHFVAASAYAGASLVRSIAKHTDPEHSCNRRSDAMTLDQGWALFERQNACFRQRNAAITRAWGATLTGAFWPVVYPVKLAFFVMGW